MISAIIYTVLIGLNILAYSMRTDSARWFNLVAILFMIGMAFVINWRNLP